MSTISKMNANIISDGSLMTQNELLGVDPRGPRGPRPASVTYCDGEVIRGQYTERQWDTLDPFEYKYDKKDPGYVMIINQMNFADTFGAREGSNFDVDEIIKCFGRQGYNIGRKNILKDSNKAALLEEIKRVCQDELGDTNSLIVFVLSHGELDNKFRVYDDVVTVQELVKPFLDVTWFKNKPKIFIFQTCKTSDEERQALITERDGNHYNPKEIDLYVDTALTAHPNLLLYCSTLEGHFSYRDTKRGSWFIQEFCRNIYTYGHREEILSILMRCNKCLARNYYYGDDMTKNEKQTPLFISTLMKNFYICRSKDRFFYVNQMNELRQAQKKLEDINKIMTMRRKTAYSLDQYH